MTRRGDVRTMLAGLVLVLVAGLPFDRVEGRTAPGIASKGGDMPVVRQLRELMAAAKYLGDVPAIENEHVRVHYSALQYPATTSREAEARPVVLYLRVVTKTGADTVRLLDAPGGTRPSWHPGVLPRGVHIEILKSPAPSSSLGEPGTDPPKGSTEEEHGKLYCFVRAVFRPQDYGVGTGRFASVTTALSDSVIEVKARGVRRRMGVRAGDTFWFEPCTRLTVVDDYPLDVAIVQLYAR